MYGYRLILASSVGSRDGMGMELSADDGTRVAEVFDDDETGRRTVTLFLPNVPFEAVEWLLSEARKWL
ncbi:hypothetical protein GCM10023221_15940 [Luteimicrobium xylanilyticum]